MRLGIHGYASPLRSDGGAAEPPVKINSGTRQEFSDIPLCFDV